MMQKEWGYAFKGWSWLSIFTKKFVSPVIEEQGTQVLLKVLKDLNNESLLVTKRVFPNS